MSVLDIFRDPKFCKRCGAKTVKIQYNEEYGFNGSTGKKNIKLKTAIVCSQYRNFNVNFDGTSRKEHGLGLSFRGDPDSHTGWRWIYEYTEVKLI